MNSNEILKKLKINPRKKFLFLTAEEALDNLLCVIEEYCPELRVEEMTREDMLTLLNSYSQCIIDYQPESNHQERGALLENYDMLEKYGMTEEHFVDLDFA